MDGEGREDAAGRGGPLALALALAPALGSRLQPPASSPHPARPAAPRQPAALTVGDGDRNGGPGRRHLATACRGARPARHFRPARAGEAPCSAGRAGPAAILYRRLGGAGRGRGNGGTKHATQTGRLLQVILCQ